MPGHVFRVSLGAGEVGEGEVVALTGSSPELGAWAGSCDSPLSPCYGQAGDEDPRAGGRHPGARRPGPRPGHTRHAGAPPGEPSRHQVQYALQ